MLISNGLKTGKMLNSRDREFYSIKRATIAKWHDAFVSEVGGGVTRNPLTWKPIWVKPEQFLNFGRLQEGELITTAIVGDVELALVAAKNPYGGVNLLFIEDGEAVAHGNKAALALAARYDCHYGSNLVSSAKQSPFYSILFNEFES